MQCPAHDQRQIPLWRPRGGHAAGCRLHGGQYDDAAAAAAAAAAAYKTRQTALWSAAAPTYVPVTAALLGPLHQQIAQLCATHFRLRRWTGGAAQGVDSAAHLCRQASTMQGVDVPRVLDVCSGGGQPALAIAAALPGVSVMATDAAPGMVAEAQGLARRLGLANLR